MNRGNAFRAASRKFLLLTIPLLACYGVAIVVCIRLVDLDSMPIPLRTLCALLVSVPMLGIFWAIYRFIRNTDEYTRVRILWALAEGGLVLGALLFIFGYLAYLGVVPEVPIFVFGSLYQALAALALVRQNFSDVL